MKIKGGGEEKALTDHTEYEIRQVYHSMTTGIIEDILTGDREL